MPPLQERAGTFFRKSAEALIDSPVAAPLFGAVGIRGRSGIIMQILTSVAGWDEDCRSRIEPMEDGDIDTGTNMLVHNTGSVRTKIVGGDGIEYTTLVSDKSITLGGEPHAEIVYEWTGKWKRHHRKTVILNRANNTDQDTIDGVAIFYIEPQINDPEI